MRFRTTYIYSSKYQTKQSARGHLLPRETGIHDEAVCLKPTCASWAEYKVRSFPWRDRLTTFYETFIAEFFLTQTPADNIAGVFTEFVDRFPSLGAIDRADREDLEDAIESLGFQRIRSEALSEIAASRDEVPQTPEELTDLPQVGPYVANATACFNLEVP